MDEELDVLRAIYDEELKGPDHCGWYSVRVGKRLERIGGDKIGEIWFYFFIHDSFPVGDPPGMRIQCDGITEDEDLKVMDYIHNSLFEENEGCLFIIISWLQSELVDFLGLVQCNEESSQDEEDEEEENLESIEIITGDSITDRKSKFVAHLAVVNHRSQVPIILKNLKTNHKIAKATHNILAYRIKMENGELDQHRDDDGEGGAGDKLLELLDKCHIENILIIVTRWYGGTHLGPDRFKHINERALSLLKQCGYIKNT